MIMKGPITHAARDAMGKVKKGTGKVTSQADLDRKGQADRGGAGAEQVGDKVADAAAEDLFDD